MVRLLSLDVLDHILSSHQYLKQHNSTPSYSCSKQYICKSNPLLHLRLGCTVWTTNAGTLSLALVHLINQTFFSHVGGGFRRLHHSGRVPPHAEPEDLCEEASAVGLCSRHWRSIGERPGALPAAVCQGITEAHWAGVQFIRLMFLNIVEEQQRVFKNYFHKIKAVQTILGLWFWNCSIPKPCTVIEFHSITIQVVLSLHFHSGY